ncbi:MAG: hypothetical protein ABSC25_17160 [Roseiarcus sp.]|jgi:hypothetical protein
MQKRAREPGTPKPTLDAPDEVNRFLNGTADRLYQLDVKGWYAEITRLYKLSVDHDLGLHSIDRNIIVIPEAGGAVIGHIGGPFATFVVNVNMPDAMICAEFERWLEEVRKQIKPHVAKPGQRTRNSKFDKTKFWTWADVRIVQFADLLAWRATLDPIQRKKYKKSDLGRWIGRYSSKDVNTTERMLKRALASLPALGGQIEHELAHDQDHAEGSREATAARIAKDIARGIVPVIRRITGKDSC